MFLQVLITIGASQALTLAILILLKRQKNQSDLLLSLKLFLIFTIIMLFNYKEEIQTISPYIPINAFVIGFLAVPVFYLYVKSTSQGQLDFSSPKILSHFIPFLAANLILAFNFYNTDLCTQENTLCMIESGTDQPLWFDTIYYGLFLGVFPFYLFRSFRLLQKHEAFLLTKFSYTEDVSLSWLSRFMLGMGLVWLAFLFFEVVPNSIQQETGKLGFQLSFLAMIANVFYLGIYGLRQRIIFFDVQENPSELMEESFDIKYQYSNLTEDRADTYLRKLRQYMDQHKPYLEPRISIGELADRTNIPVNYLSQVINEKLDQNFFDFINSYRVEEFKELVRDPEKEHYTLLSLGFEAGFNSKSTFNAIFKKFTGLTPSEYTRRLNMQNAPG